MNDPTTIAAFIGAGGVVCAAAVSGYYSRKAAQDAAESKRQMTTNGYKSSPATLLDDIHLIRDRQLEDREKTASEFEAVRSELSDVKAAQETHEGESGRYLGRVSLVLSEHGIKLPNPSDPEE